MKHHGRRQFLQAGLALAGSSLLSGCGLPPLPGQRAAKVPGIGFPNASTAADPIVAQQLAGLRQGLSELGYVEGRNVTEFTGPSQIVTPRTTAFSSATAAESSPWNQRAMFSAEGLTSVKGATSLMHP